MTTVSAQSQSNWYRNSRRQMEQTLHGSQATEFAVQVQLGNQEYSFTLWQGQQLPDQLLAFDTETAAIQGREIPQLALAAVCGDAGSAYFIHPDQLAEFVLQHGQVYWAAHNGVFDFWVTAQHLQTHPLALNAWWDIAGQGRLCCTMLLDELIRLARIDAEPVARGLDVVAKENCGLSLDKNDPYRLRYAELIGVSSGDWQHIETGFWEYAAKDPVATLLVLQRQIETAQQLIAPYRDELFPDALRRFGPLTACVQVQGAIALDYISRRGIHVDVGRAQRLKEHIAELVGKRMTELEELGGTEIFKRYKKTGERQIGKSGVAKRNSKVIKQQLAKVARRAAEPIRPPKNKDGLVTDAVKFWSQYQHVDPFIKAYVGFSEQAKLMQFLRELSQDRIYPTYDPLKRTGRTSCRSPNLQQLPRDSRFREIIIAPPGYWLLQIDFSVLELRTLAQVCLRRYRHSVLAELFAKGVDPHRYTAALLLGNTLEEFEMLAPLQQKKHRQRAKAINFGVPGGLGAASLVSYAKQSYAVEMTFEEAREFKRYLLTDIYPELSAYLQDRPYLDLSLNLSCTESSARQAFSTPRQVSTASRIVAGETESPAGDRYEQDLIDHAWLVLQQLNKKDWLDEALAAKEPSLELSRRVFLGRALTISGRLRGHVGYTQRANTPFQSLAADGNKLALFRLLQHGFQVCGFIHDEMLVLIPDGVDYDAAVDQVQQILCSSMQEFCPDIPIQTEWLLADRWYKDVDEQPVDAAGRIVPYRQLEKGPTKATDLSMLSPTSGRKRIHDPDAIYSFIPRPCEELDEKEVEVHTASDATEYTS